MDKQVIFKKIETARSKRFLTNCYSLDVVEHCQAYWSIEDEFIFSYEDHGIQRLVFFASAWDAVNRLLESIENGKYFLEYMTRDFNEYKPKNSTQVAAMMRYSNSDCRSVFDKGSPVLQFKDAVSVETANENDTEEINRILWSTFHTEISHLLSNDELIKKIKDKQITVHRNEDNKIDALLQAEVMPKKFYINHALNRGSREIIHAILLSRLEQYISTGGKYFYAWVEDANKVSLKFLEKYGLKHDGMLSMIYRIER